MKRPRLVIFYAEGKPRKAFIGIYVTIWLVFMWLFAFYLQVCKHEIKYTMTETKPKSSEKVP